MTQTTATAAASECIPRPKARRESKVARGRRRALNDPLHDTLALPLPVLAAGQQLRELSRGAVLRGRQLSQLVVVAVHQRLQLGQQTLQLAQLVLKVAHALVRRRQLALVGLVQRGRLELCQHDRNEHANAHLHGWTHR